MADQTFLRSPRSRLKVWDVQTSNELVALTGEAAKSASLAYSPDGKKLACSGNAVLEAETGQKLFALPGSLRSVAFTPDGKYLATPDGQGGVKLLDSTSGREVRTLTRGRSRTGGFLFSPDGKRIAMIGGEGKIVLLDASTGLEVLSMEGSKNVLFSPDGNRLACNGPKNTIRIYDATPVPEKP